VANVVYLEPETRHILQAHDQGIGAYSEPFSRWLVTYNAVAQWEGHVEGMLRNLKVRDPNWFNQVIEHINQFLRQNGKELTDFDTNLRLTVRLIGTDSSYPIADLSSGEQQCLILIFMVSRWLMDGGVVLIDEPDLHIHGSWQRSLIHELQAIVASKQGQMIITSHSGILSEEYPESRRFNLEAEPQKQ
jgi:AAA15 family ATPase/GTPase